MARRAFATGTSGHLDDTQARRIDLEKHRFARREIETHTRTHTNTHALTHARSLSPSAHIHNANMTQSECIQQQPASSTSPVIETMQSQKHGGPTATQLLQLFGRSWLVHLQLEPAKPLGRQQQHTQNTEHISSYMEKPLFCSACTLSPIWVQHHYVFLSRRAHAGVHVYYTYFACHCLGVAHSKSPGGHKRLSTLGVAHMLQIA